MVDVPDSKSGVSDDVWVRVPSPLPNTQVLKQHHLKEKGTFIMTEMEKKVKIMRTQNRISLMESRGEYNRRLVNALKRELRALNK